jgi:hypothetical protein
VLFRSANAIFGFAWSFDVFGEPVIVRWQKKVLIWNQQEKRTVPSLDANGNVQTEEVGLVYITGKVSVDLDGKLYRHADLGRCVFTGDTPEALDMALAGSVTDCLKRCFRQMGEQFGNRALWYTVVVFLTKLGRAGRMFIGHWLTLSRKAMGTVACQ